ncbi:MAG: hypothetical protein AB7V42_13345 [Thermoleophilia bacterium]
MNADSALSRLCGRLRAELGDDARDIVIDTGAGAAGTPRVVVPAWDPADEAAAARELLARADVVALLDAADAPATSRRSAVVVVGLPSPGALSDADAGVDHGTAGAELVDLWARRGRGGRGPGRVAWVGGRGPAPLAEALEAWAGGRAVVTLPGVRDHGLLRRGLALRARTAAEVVEATDYLLGAPALTRALAARGRDAIAALPTAAEVADRLRDAARPAIGGRP